MKQVVLDAATRAKLNGLTSQLEVVDEEGNLLGHFMPLDPGRFSPFTDAEIEAARNDKRPGRPLADILADLRRNYP